MKTSDLRREKDELKSKLTEERQKREELQGKVMDALSDKQDTMEEILSLVEKMAEKDGAIKQAPVIGKEGIYLLKFVLLAPKVLLNYVRPMITIQSHPIHPYHASDIKL